MFTLVYINGSLNKPDTLLSFLQSNVGKSPVLQIDCVTPYKGTEQELINLVCKHLSSIDPQIEVKYNTTHNISAEVKQTNNLVHFIVLQIVINYGNQLNK